MGGARGFHAPIIRVNRLRDAHHTSSPPLTMRMQIRRFFPNDARKVIELWFRLPSSLYSLG
jgi:hypothetical protein